MKVSLDGKKCDLHIYNCSCKDLHLRLTDGDKFLGSLRIPKETAPVLAYHLNWSYHNEA